MMIWAALPYLRHLAFRTKRQSMRSPRTEARLREQPFIVIEMTEVDFDVDLPPETFKIDLPNGETFEDVSQRAKAHWPATHASSPGCGIAKASCPGGHSRRDTARGSCSARPESLCRGSGEGTVGQASISECTLRS